MNVVINASNLHVGGGVQVATSFIYELSLLSFSEVEFTVIVSTEVDKNLRKINCDHYRFYRYVVHDVNGFKSIDGFLRRLGGTFNLIFTIFGPYYSISNRIKSVVGFAQAWIAYPKSAAWDTLRPISRLIFRIKFGIQWWFFKRADLLIVELPHVKTALINNLGYLPEKIEIVRNCLSGVFQNKELWSDIRIDCESGYLKLGYIGRNYHHKNTSVFPAVANILSDFYKIKVKFYVTFTDDEWRATSEDFRRCCINVGALDVVQCPFFYRHMDAVVFPTLLECFSAVPLEARFMGTPIFLSDFQFNRDICGEYGIYFNPIDPANIARCINDWYVNKIEPSYKKSVEYMEEDSSSIRARSYLNLILRS